MADIAPRGVFISRQRELSLLCRALEEAQRRHGQVVLVSGEAGIGKTRLAQELAAIAASGTVSVLWGRCVQGEASPPYWPWTQIVRSFAENRSGVLCATSFDGAVCRLTNGALVELPPPPGPPNKGCRGYVDPSGSIW